VASGITSSRNAKGVPKGEEGQEDKKDLEVKNDEGLFRGPNPFQPKPISPEAMGGLDTQMPMPVVVETQPIMGVDCKVSMRTAKTSSNLMLDMLNHSMINMPILQDQGVEEMTPDVGCPLPVDETHLFCDEAEKD
jgi:hypothetical protein